MPIVNRIREILLRHPEVITVVSQHGRPDNGSDAAGFFNAEFFVPLKPFDEWPPGMTKEKLIEELQTEFAKEFTGIGFNFSQYIQDNVEEGLVRRQRRQLRQDHRPRSRRRLKSSPAEAMHEMDAGPGVTDLGIFRVLGQPNLNITIDREKAARYGLNVSDVNTVVQAALGGTVATTLLEADRQFNVTVRLAPEFRDSLDAIRNIKVGYQTPSGNAYIPLSELATITLDTGASYIFRERNQRFVPIKFSVRGRDLAGAVAEAQQRIAKNVKLPTGYRIEWAGEFEGLQQAQEAACHDRSDQPSFSSWCCSTACSIRCATACMALLGIPFSVSGGILALYVSGLDFSISAAIGFVSLFGVSVMSGILIITCYNRVCASGMSTIEAMFHAVEQQMRPILMMALSACIGLLPAAISTGIGSQVQRPLATVVVGGMLIGRSCCWSSCRRCRRCSWIGTGPPAGRECRGERDLAEVVGSRNRPVWAHGEPREDLSNDFGCRRIRRAGDDCEHGSAQRRQGGTEVAAAAPVTKAPVAGGTAQDRCNRRTAASIS